jgi:protein SCO1/2
MSSSEPGRQVISPRGKAARWLDGACLVRVAALAVICAYVDSLAGAPLAFAHQDPPAIQSGRSPLVTTPRLPLIKPAPDFVLVDTSGRPTRLSELRGHVVLISFIYTACTSACPLLTQRMALLRKRLTRAGVGADRTTLLSITVDPGRDSTEALGRYAAHFGAASEGWRFLREEPARLQPVLAAYDEWTRRQPDGEIDHPARLYLVDRKGAIREIYSLAFFDERQAFLDIQALLGEAR